MARLGTIIGASTTALVLAGVFAVGGAFAAGDDCPPNAEPGKCYEKVLLPGYDVYTGGGYSRARETTFQWREVPCRPGAGGYRVSESRVITSPQLVSAVQSALTVEGYYSGPITGEANVGTEQGLARFQSERGLVRGWTQQTMRALGVSYPE